MFLARKTMGAQNLKAREHGPWRGAAVGESPVGHFTPFQATLLNYYKQRVNPCVHFLKRLSKVRTNVLLTDFSSANASIFLCEYNPDFRDPHRVREKWQRQLRGKQGGVLGV